MKVCTKCNRGLNESRFSKTGKYLSSHCKDCRATYQREETAKKKGVEPPRKNLPDNKICTRCKINKRRGEFGLNKTCYGVYLSPYCKPCSKEKQIESRRKRGIPERRRKSEKELPEHKKCTRCKETKTKEHFRIKRPKHKGNEYVFLQSHCRECEIYLAKIYYAKKKNDPEFKRKNVERVRNYAKSNPDKIKSRKQTEEFKKKHSELEGKRYHRMKDIINAKLKEKRKNPILKQKRREYIKKNKAKIFKQEVITKKRYHEKNKSLVTDVYTINILRGEGKLNPSREEIDIKKAKILTWRIKKLLQNLPAGEGKICTICKEEKDLSNFWGKKQNKNGKQPYCKYCGTIRNNKYKIKKNERHSISS